MNTPESSAPKAWGVQEIENNWDYNDPAKTEEKFRKVLTGLHKSDDKESYISVLTQVARTHSLRQNFDKANAILDTVKGMLSNDMKEPLIRYHLERGRVFNSSNEKSRAVEQFGIAFDKALESQASYLAIDAAHMLGIAEKGDAQINWNLKAMELAEQSDNDLDKKWLGALYNNLGWTFHDNGEYNKALELFEKGLSWRQERKDTVGTFIAKWTIARTYRSQEKIGDALELQMSLLSEIEVEKVEPDGYVYEEIGECCLTLGLHDKSKPYFLKAYDLLSKDKWLQKNEQKRLNRLEELSR